MSAENTVSLSYEDFFECVALVYAKWSNTFDVHKKCKAALKLPIKGEPDWALLREIQLEDATETLEKWQGILDRMRPHLKPLY